tara:strand:+ start:90 stop:497 length:408 start_codon:yes stop_codon:yes gene_type:complete
MNKPFLVVTLLVATGAGGFWLISENRSKDPQIQLDENTSMNLRFSRSSEQTSPSQVPSISSKPVTDDHNVSSDWVPVEKEPTLWVALPDSTVLIVTSDEERNIGPILNADEMLYSIEDIEEQNVGTYIEVEMPDP